MLSSTVNEILEEEEEKELEEIDEESSLSLLTFSGFFSSIKSGSPSFF